MTYIVYPVEKSETVDDMLYSFTGLKRKDITLARDCITCHESATQFKDADSQAEYANSGMCQLCQDDISDGVATFNQTVVWSLTRIA